MTLEDDEATQAEERLVFLKKTMHVKNSFLIDPIGWVSL